MDYLREIKEIWLMVQDSMKQQLSTTAMNLWFGDIEITSFSNDTLTMTTSTEFKMNTIKEKYLSQLEALFEEFIGFHVNIVVKFRNPSLKIDDIKNQIASEDILPEREQDENDISDISSLGSTMPTVNFEYTFDNFIVGNNNNYAHAVALAVAESPAEVYNPLFIHGGSGLGKTHLMHAIGHYILEHNPSKKVLYVSSEMFTSELIKALQDGKNKNAKMRAFNNKYRNVDVLLIDDIQFIEGKDATQTEFFHTFNTLYDFKKQIVISSDRHPSKLTDLDERLRSRFQWNIVADIQPPDFETRVAILRNKTEQEKVEIDDDVLEVIDLIAEKVKFNIRELESALTRIISYSKIFNEKITVKFARKNLNDIFSTSDFNITCESIKKEVCKKYNIKI